MPLAHQATALGTLGPRMLCWGGEHWPCPWALPRRCQESPELPSQPCLQTRASDRWGQAPHLAGSGYSRACLAGVLLPDTSQVLPLIIISMPVPCAGDGACEEELGTWASGLQILTC